MNGNGGSGNMNGDATVTVVHNFIGGSFVQPAQKQFLDVVRPQDCKVIGRVAMSTSEDVNVAVLAAKTAFNSWSSLTIKARASIMLEFHALVKQHAQELADLIVQENGKNITEALADVAKGNETVEYACSLPQLAQGRILQVSGEVSCRDERKPLGVVASIVPFNFPFMVPMWTFPIALVMGNCMILKPSEKVPLTMNRVAQLAQQAGFPNGVFGLVHGGKDAVQAILNHDDVQAVTFVGSSPVANIVASTCRALNKRCTALGGAKNHLVALEDCDTASAASDIVVSFAGCAGQRCMAASVLLLIGTQEALVQAIVEKASQIKPGNGPGEMGPVIDDASHAKILSYIQDAEQSGTSAILLDGRSWATTTVGKKNWIGPTILLHTSSHDKTMCEEVFGPVLSIYKCRDWDEAIAIENNNPYGNAASIYTSNGAHADWFTSRFRAAMLGVNIGIPVPREPFSFGGLYGTKSKFGDLDITGDGGMEFFSNRIKVSTKWPAVTASASARGHDNGNKNSSKRKAAGMDATSDDHANFAGSM